MYRSGSRVISGHLEVTTAGTALPLLNGFSGATKTFLEGASLVGVYVSADTGNTEAVVVGDKNVKAKVKEANGVVLFKTSLPVFIPIVDLRTLFADVQKSGEFLSILVVVR